MDGLLGNERRKTGWMRAEAAGDPGPWRQQAILGRGQWEADGLRDIVRGYALDTLADETRFWSSMKPDFSSRARPHAALLVNIPVRRARYELPDRRIRLLCFATRPRLHRPGALFAKSVDRRSSPHEGGACSRENSLRNQACPRVNMIERAIAAAVPFAGLPPIAFTALAGLKTRSPGRQGLCAWSRFQSQRQLLGQAQAYRRDGRKRCERPGAFGLETPFGGRWRQGAAPL